MSRSCFLILALLATASGLTGCGYLIGSPHPPEIRTVSVPIATNETFRRGVEFQLTEAVHEQIQSTTHMRLGRDAEADARLTMQIIDVRKDVLGETAFDDARELQLSYAVVATLEDLRTGAVHREEIAIPAATAQFLSTAAFAPEVGQSLATARQRVIDDLARQIVNRMEVPW
ncbi:MAG: hypothetical protein KY476_17555 [Planctomycetes bacterium]|nr:hypothetical protein [Planctomycetota bacterium]